jgi:ribokinase
LTSVLNYGSLNIDHRYRVPSLVRPGETLASLEYGRTSGGKGHNQSIALARAGVPVAHAGKVGRDGTFLIEGLRRAGVDTEHVDVVDSPTGHAVIQVDDRGENAIVLHRGANHEVTVEEAEAVIATRKAGSFLLLQNEISCVGEILKLGLARGLEVAFNPAPMTADVAAMPLDRLALLVVNEAEGRDLSGEHGAGAILDALHAKWPETPIVLTTGVVGAHYVDRAERLFEPAPSVHAVDTTAAGDTFVGYFLAELMRERKPAEALCTASRAAAICVTRPGAADAIPSRHEL